MTGAARQGRGVRLTRRTALASGLAGWAVAGTAGVARAATSRATYVEGTTLASICTPASTTGYTRLVDGPGYELVVREDLAAARVGRDDRRSTLASLVQFTDLHMIDAQSPVRFEWLGRVNGSAFRPQEALGTHGAAQLVRRVNQLGRGPFGGRPFDCVVSTGDNTDNHEHVELDWFLTVMNGGDITQDTGDPHRWEGVQSSGRRQYWNPELPVADDYKQAGFPTLPGYFTRATATHRSEGLATPWFSVFGNHDDSVSGVLPSDFAGLARAYVGDQKFMGFADPAANQQMAAAMAADTTAAPSTASLFTTTVTPDARRAPFTPKQYVQAHLAPEATGPGPVGHGFTQDNVDQGTGHYTFRIAPGVTGIAMDSTNHAGFTEGSLGDTQFRWLQQVLQAGSRRWFDVWGVEHTHDVDDELFVLFSHHTSTSMGNLLVDPTREFEIRHGGLEVVNTLKRFPNVVAWVNGHTHVNKITPQRHRDPRRSFWEVNTASHVDFPQMARIIDVCDNHDGTLSLFTTLIESAAPVQAGYTDGSQEALASLYRELSWNDPHNSRTRSGGPGDRNTELLLVSPLA